MGGIVSQAIKLEVKEAQAPPPPPPPPIIPGVPNEYLLIAGVGVGVIGFIYLVTRK